MNINFGLLPDILRDPETGRKIKGRDRKLAYTARAKKDFAAWLADSALDVPANGTGAT